MSGLILLCDCSYYGFCSFNGYFGSCYRYIILLADLSDDSQLLLGNWVGLGRASQAISAVGVVWASTVPVFN